MKKLFLFFAAAALLLACSPTKKSEEVPSEGKYLVLYYSQTGATYQLAQDFADLLSADTASFDVVEPYDGSYDETIQRCIAEQQSDSLSALCPLSVDIDDYDVIFLGYPIWFGTYARPVMSLIKENSFKDKTIVPFCTFGSGGLASSVSDLRQACPEAIVLDGYGVRAARIDKARQEVEQYLIETGFLEGEIDEQSDYSEQQAVSDEDKEIFEAACGGYPMPIGTPQTVGKRPTETGTDYLFTVSSTLPNGATAQALVYITCEKDSKPEFTRVER